jgi:hypothetical protein
VSLNWEGIEEIVEEGIKLKTGEVVPLDIIIFGTGYSLVSCLLLGFHALMPWRYGRNPKNGISKEAMGKR